MARTKEEYNASTRDELRELCKKRGLPVGGKKDEIVKRLMENDATIEESPVSAQASPVAIDSHHDPVLTGELALYNKRVMQRLGTHENMIIKNQGDIAGLQVGHNDLEGRHENLEGRHEKLGETCGRQFARLHRSASKSERKLKELQRSAARTDRELKELKKALKFE